MTIYVKIKKTYGSFSLDVEFEASNGVMGLLGASGCGKSMTLKCIAGVIKPDEGIVVVDGETLFDSKKKINVPPQKRKIALLFQNYALFPNMTVAENLRCVLQGKSDAEKSARYKEIMEKLYINGLDEHYPSQLSGGQQQRVALARILASNPKVIMLDEPLSALDSYLRWQLEGVLAKLFMEFTGTTLYVSHNRDEVFRLCNKICVIHKGKNEPVCPAEKLFDAPGTLATSRLSGCKNHAVAQKSGERKVYIKAWDTTFECGSVPDDLKFIGIRAHNIHLVPKAGANIMECNVLSVEPDLFSTVVTLCPSSCAGRSTGIRVETTEDEAKGLKPKDSVKVYILPSDIMHLV